MTLAGRSYRVPDMWLSDADQGGLIISPSTEVRADSVPRSWSSCTISPGSTIW